MKNSPKIAIQASLDELDSRQAAEVLQYIKGLLSQPRKHRDYYAFRKEALKEIQRALNEDGQLTLTS